MLPWLLQTIDIATALEAILVGVLLGANIALLLVSANGWADVQQRAAKLAVLNLLPLAAAILIMIPMTLHAVIQQHCQVAMKIHYLLMVMVMHIWPGQYLYLWLPHSGFHLCFQLQPFYVTYWNNAPGPRILLSINFSPFTTIVFIIEDIGMFEQRRAMVRKLKIDLLDLDHSEFKIYNNPLRPGTSINPGPIVAREHYKKLASIYQQVRDAVQLQTRADIKLFNFNLKLYHTWAVPCRDNNTVINIQSDYQK
ncbi:uncharacterized protein BO88DRAFT_427235 [Aspergillus vadensis CBS 113365]|uniref:Uncharacterized protein n=1 Tax=Aspergillus vadensis (strain CBS 113365 / IMI 142717 / IBT 24658) TaxID=1448311 RepID=A0A319B2R4_ASPVC|nr:hypothetical protein BO88DRAFT_427235 [Aspergillus vadensis CBS 113365]PYH67026.1 hypothetical protein BO88DRAFT_427235 [Aspergillus vadensis CBS 113365]